MNDALEKIEIEIIKCQAEFDLAVSCLVKTLNAFNYRMEAVEKWIQEEKKRMLN